MKISLETVKEIKRALKGYERAIKRIKFRKRTEEFYIRHAGHSVDWLSAQQELGSTRRPDA